MDVIIDCLKLPFPHPKINNEIWKKNPFELDTFPFEVQYLKKREFHYSTTKIEF